MFDVLFVELENLINADKKTEQGDSTEDSSNVTERMIVQELSTFVCKECGKIFISQDYLNKHSIKHVSATISIVGTSIDSSLAQDPQCVSNNNKHDRQIYHVVQHKDNPRVRSCFGCARQIIKKGEMLLKSFCKRPYIDRNTHLQVISPTIQSVYFHMKLDCVRKKNALMEPTDIIVHQEVLHGLSKRNRNDLAKLGVKL
jgi:hypothetical protein